MHGGVGGGNREAAPYPDSCLYRLKAWMPTDQVRGLKAHGTSPAKTKLAGELLPLAAARFFPGQPCAMQERDNYRKRK